MLSRSLAGFTFIAIASSLLACTRNDTSSPTPTPINAAIYAQGVCNHLVRCSPAFVREHFADNAECVQRVEAEAARLFALQGVRVSRAEVNTCAVEVDKASCDVDVDTIAACDFKGVFLEGQGCTIGAQCGSGSCLHAPTAEDGACGSCAGRVGLGDSCESAACAPGLVCRDKTCEAKTKRGKARDEPCDPTTTPCDGAQGLVCEGGRCQEKIASLGSSCAAVPFCERSFCDAAKSKVCKAHSVQGGACASTLECVFPLRCSAGACALATACP